MHEHGVVLFDTKTGQLFASNLTGARVWDGLSRHRPIDCIADEISRLYQISLSTAHAHIAQFVARLEEQHLIERSAA
jgi:hypothetical protein